MGPGCVLERLHVLHAVRVPDHRSDARRVRARRRRVAPGVLGRGSRRLMPAASVAISLIVVLSIWLADATQRLRLRADCLRPSTARTGASSWPGTATAPISTALMTDPGVSEGRREDPPSRSDGSTAGLPSRPTRSRIRLGWSGSARSSTRLLQATIASARSGRTDGSTHGPSTHDSAPTVCTSRRAARSRSQPGWVRLSTDQTGEIRSTVPRA